MTVELTHARTRSRPGARPPARPPAPTVRARRVIVFAALLALLAAVVSYAQVLFAASDSSLAIRSVEWLRDNGARGVVNEVESIYYSLNAPATGGPALRALPRQAGADATSRSLPPKPRLELALAYRPPNVAPVIHPALPGEGVWHATFATAAHAPVLITSFRPDPNYPRLVAGVAWIDHTRTSTELYPGRLEPDVAMPDRGPVEVPVRKRPALVATFNSAFKIRDSRGGFAYGGHAYAPMRSGMATIVRYRDGRVDVVAWNGGSGVSGDVVYARQNLPLIVNGGRPNPNLSDGPEWGYTLGNAVRVWRSAVGVDARGNLIYAAANDQTVGSLAAIMIRAGAVRAMELDINTYWTSFITYRQPGAVGAANLLPDMDRSPQRYLSAEDRDFFAVYIR